MLSLIVRGPGVASGVGSALGWRLYKLWNSRTGVGVAAINVRVKNHWGHLLLS